jgi:hypothetical protein
VPAVFHPAYVTFSGIIMTDEEAFAERVEETWPRADRVQDDGQPSALTAPQPLYRYILLALRHIHGDQHGTARLKLSLVTAGRSQNGCLDNVTLCIS